MSENPSNAAAYIEYFRQKAVRHKDLRHDPLSETGDAAIDGRHFARIEVQEIIKGMRSKCGWPALLLELYNTDTSAEVVYDVRQRPKGAFMVLDQVVAGDYLDEERAYIVTEKILYQILQQIWADHYGPSVNRCNTPFKEWDLSYEIIPIGPVLDYQFGWRVEFSFRFHNNINLAKAPEAGAFL